MDALLYIIAGGAVLLGLWVPLLIRRAPLSLPMLAIAAGFLLPVFPDVSRPFRDFGPWLEAGATLAMIAAVFAAGLSIDRPFGWKSWQSTWRLLGVAMPLTIVFLAVAGQLLLALPLSAAVLLAAIIAPTDPVLASDVRVGRPGSGRSGPLPFALTSEAGINDGLALPFVMLGLALVDGSMDSPVAFVRWFAIDLIVRTAAGAALGAGLAGALRWIQRFLPERFQLRQTQSGVAGLGVGLLTYGLCELIGANGFVGVFANAVTARRLGVELRFSRRIARAALETEHLAMIALMLFFGFALRHGVISRVDVPEVVFAALALLALRQLATSIGFLGSAENRGVRLAIGYFGIRGISTIYYMVHTAERLPAGTGDTLLSVACLVVLFSVVLFGTTTSPVLNLLPEDDRRAYESSGTPPET